MKTDSFHVVYGDPGGLGYHPVLYLARLAARLLEARLDVVPLRQAGWRDKLRGVFSRKGQGSACCLMICPSPTYLNSILFLEEVRKRSGVLIAWVFDSFWPEHIPKWVSYSGLFDHVLVTENEDIDEWRRKVRAPVEWVPWGTDALGLGSPGDARSIDLLRVGREPPEWEDDVQNGHACAEAGMRYRGRPPAYSDADENERNLMHVMGQSKYVLAFTNRVSPSLQTHPIREYITGRWTDAVAAGAIVAGVPPDSDSTRELFWPETLLDLGTPRRDEGLRILGEDLRAWTPERAQLNYRNALARLDWRWRLRTVSALADLSAPRLTAELEELERRIESPGRTHGEPVRSYPRQRTAGR